MSAHRWYRRIEVTSMKGEPGEYDCLLCEQPLEGFSGEAYIAYRLTVQPISLVAILTGPATKR